MKLKKFIPFCFLFIVTLALPQTSFAEEKIEDIPIISETQISNENKNIYSILFAFYWGL